LTIATMAAIAATSYRQNVCRVRKDFTMLIVAFLCQDYSAEITRTGLADFSKPCSTLRPPFSSCNTTARLSRTQPQGYLRSTSFVTEIPPARYLIKGSGPPIPVSS
jgi:hypothetical protein